MVALKYSGSAAHHQKTLTLFYWDSANWLWIFHGRFTHPINADILHVNPIFLKTNDAAMKSAGFHCNTWHGNTNRSYGYASERIDLCLRNEPNKMHLCSFVVRNINSFHLSKYSPLNKIVALNLNLNKIDNVFAAFSVCCNLLMLLCNLFLGVPWTKILQMLCIVWMRHLGNDNALDLFCHFSGGIIIRIVQIAWANMTLIKLLFHSKENKKK